MPPEWHAWLHYISDENAVNVRCCFLLHCGYTVVEFSHFCTTARDSAAVNVSLGFRRCWRGVQGSRQLCIQTNCSTQSVRMSVDSRISAPPALLTGQQHFPLAALLFAGGVEPARLLCGGQRAPLASLH